MEQLIRQIHLTQKLLQKPEANWAVCSDSIDELATAVESLKGIDNYQEVVRHLLSLSSEIGAQITSIRSKLVRDVCEHLLRIVHVTGRDFQEMANALLPQLISTAKNTLVAVRQPGNKLLSEVTKTVRYDLPLLRKIYMQSNHDRPRVLVLEQLRLIFVYWSDDEVIPWESDVLEIMRQGLDDQHDKVRKVAREVLCRFSSRWSASVEELAQMLSNQAKVLLVSEYRDSGLANAIIENYPELMAKAESTSAVRTRVRQNLSRSSLQKRDQVFEKQASATMPRGQVEEKQPRSNDVTTNSRPAAFSKMTESNATARSLLSDSNGTGESEPLEISIGSQLHDSRPTQEILQAVHSDSGQPSNPLADVPSESPVARTLVNSDDVVNQKISKIETSSSLSLGVVDKKHVDTNFASSNSPESSMLKFEEKSEASTLVVDDAQVKEKTVELKNLSASDEYFSKRMSSSVTTTTLRSPSNENVTFRPKVARQEDDDLLPQTYLPEISSLELPPEMSAQSEFSELMPDLAIQSNQKVLLASCRAESDTTNDSVELNENPRNMFGNDMGLDESHIDDNWPDDTCNLSDEIGVSMDKEYFNKRMSSSVAIPKLHSPSNENAAFQPKVACQEDDDVLPQTYFPEMSSFELSPKMSARSQSTELPEHALPSDQETVSRRCNQYEEFVSRNEFDVTDLEVEGGHLESDHKVLLGSSRAESEATNDSVELKENQLGNDMGLEDEWHFDENWPEGTCKLSDEIALDNDLKSRVDNRQTATVTEQDVLQTDWRAGFLPDDSSPTRSEAEEKDGRDGDFSSVSLPKDALTGLVDLHDQVKRLRLETINDEEKNFRRHELNSVKNTQEMNEAVSSQHLEKTEEPNHGCSRILEHHEPLKGSREFGQTSGPTPEQDGNNIENYDADENERETNALGLKAPTITSRYNRPPSPKTECFRFPSLQYERLPSPQLETKLNPSAAKARTNKVEVEEEVVAPVEAETKAESKVDDDEVSPSFNEPFEEQAPDDKKQSDSSRHSISKPSPVIAQQGGPKPASGWVSYCGLVMILILAGSFGIAGLLHAAKTIRNSQEYHMALQSRIQQFEASIIESHQKVRKLEKEYAVWSEYVRKLTEEEEAHAVAQLEAIQLQVQEWQRDMKADLLAFRQALSVDSLEASFEKLRVTNATKRKEQ